MTFRPPRTPEMIQEINNRIAQRRAEGAREREDRSLYPRSRGGALSAASTPEQLQASAKMTRARNAERKDAMEKKGVKTPHRKADTATNVFGFNDGISGIAKPFIATNPKFKAQHESREQALKREGKK